jgi:ribosomal protein S18 acetylase RimI-like enzyme
MTESEAAFAVAISLLGRLPGARLQVDPDLTWLASGRPLASLNHVYDVALQGDPAAVGARIEAVQAAVSSGGNLPATWWIGPATTPADLGLRLQARGLTEAEPEFGMIVAVDGLPSPAGDVEEVGEAGLDEWLGVMGRSYGWSDPRAIAAWTELYGAAFGDASTPWWHVVVRKDGTAVACASLFPAGEGAFVTNVGTVPEARGAGHGTTATLAVLAIARRLGYRKASLTASLMGRGLYARIGFREEARLERYVSAGS